MKCNGFLLLTSLVIVLAAGSGEILTKMIPGSGLLKRKACNGGRYYHRHYQFIHLFIDSGLVRQIVEANQAGIRLPTGSKAFTTAAIINMPGFRKRDYPNTRFLSGIY